MMMDYITIAGYTLAVFGAGRELFFQVESKKM